MRFTIVCLGALAACGLCLRGACAPRKAGGATVAQPIAIYTVEPAPTARPPTRVSRRASLPIPNSLTRRRVLQEHLVKGRYSEATVQTLGRFIRRKNAELTRSHAEKLGVEVLDAARENRVDYRLLASLVAHESRFHPEAVSPVGAQGLGQLMPGTASHLGVRNPFDPKQNLRGTAAYLNKMLDHTHSVAKALAAYNAGPGAVAYYHGIPPYRETVHYVHVVGHSYHCLTRILPKTPAAGPRRAGGDA